MKPTRPTPRPFHPLADSSFSTVLAGFIATLTGFTSSLVLMFQAGRNAHLSDAQISSWIWALSISMGALAVLLSMRYRAPIVIAWSTPGAALLITALPSVPYSEAIGAYIVAGAIMAAIGFSGAFDALMRRVPGSIASAMLAGILFRITVEIFVSAQENTVLIGAMLLAFLVARRVIARYAILLALLIGVLVASVQGSLNFSGFHVALTIPVWTTPQFSLRGLVNIALPLLVVAMTSQNMPGLGVLRAYGYPTRSAPLIAATGIGSLLFAPFGSHGINLGAITAAICAGPEAHEDPARRYMAAVWSGLFYMVGGSFGATLAALFAAFPQALVIAIAALALLGSVGTGLAGAMQEPRERDPALITFLVTASGLTLASIGSAFWGLAAGLLAHMILNGLRRQPQP